MSVVRKSTSLIAAMALVVLACPTANAAHSTCAGAEGVHPNFLIECGSETASDANGGAGDSYEGSTCTGGGVTNGKDVVWYADMQPGWVLTVTMTPSPSVDAALYLVSDCADVPGSCVTGSNTAGAGGAETIMYTSLSTTRYYVIFDGVGDQAGGDFAITASLDCSVAIEDLPWSLIKVNYR